MNKIIIPVLLAVIVGLLVVIANQGANHEKPDGNAAEDQIPSAEPKPVAKVDKVQILKKIAVAREARDKAIQSATADLASSARIYLDRLGYVDTILQKNALEWREYYRLSPRAAALGQRLTPPVEVDQIKLQFDIRGAGQALLRAIDAYNDTVETSQLKFAQERATLEGIEQPIRISEVPMDDLPATKFDLDIAEAYKTQKNEEQIIAAMTKRFFDVSGSGLRR